MAISVETDHEAFRERAEQAGLPFVTLLEPGLPGVEHQPVNSLAATLLSPSAARHFGMVPVAFDNGEVTIATSEPFDELARQVAATFIEHELRFVVAPAAEINHVIEELAATAPAGAAEPDELDPTLLEHIGVVRQPRLGEVLLARGEVTEEAIEVALADQQRTGVRLGEILVHGGALSEQALVVALAGQFDMPLVDLTACEPDPEALEILPEPLTRRLHCALLAVDEHTLYMAVEDVLDAETEAHMREHTSLRLRTFLAPRSEIDLFLQRVHGQAYVDSATYDLVTRSPEDCANRVVTTGQRGTFAALAVLALIALVIFPIPTLVVLFALASVFYMAVSLYKVRLVYAALGHEYELDITDEEVANIDERELPVYTILVPLFKEAAVVPRLATGIEGLDYPKSKLDVRLLCEADDDETIDAIRALNLPPHFRLVVVPESQPQTKPKACNYGLLQADGEYVVIFDAEDRPDPDQLKKVYLAFQKADPAVTCVQAKLNYFNQDQNLLTRWFAIEYSMWFDLVLPGLDAADVPIPLGGTSNHFVRDRLIELGAWDPFNVTEDADLGVRLHKAGYKTAIVDSTTLEEANSQMANWVRQRSRWVKGYIQTWLVHMRNPFQLLRELGPKSFISFQLIVGGTFIFLLNPIFWLLTTVFLFTQADIIRELFPSFIFYAAAAQLFIGNFVFVYMNVAGTVQRRYYSLARYALLTPMYWGLMSLAAWKGFIQLFTNPFYWEKTEHGLDDGAGH